jgi:glutamine---fructose-6-phosphate transaminase (isomerizing)
MKTFAYDHQLETMTGVVAEVFARPETAGLDPERPILFAGIGTSLHAARIAADWVVQLTRGRVRALALDAHDVGAGAFPLQSGDQLVVISHRGKKLYPLAALARGRAAGCLTVAIVGQAAPEQPADFTIRTCANETAGTFSVSYLASLAALAKLVAATFPAEAEPFATGFAALPQAIAETLEMRPDQGRVSAFARATPILVSGFGTDFVTAQEAALKIKEGAWLWTEAMSPEFAIHGTPASYTSQMSAIVILPAQDDGGRTRLLIDVLKGLNLSAIATCGLKTEAADLAFAEPPHPLLRPFLAILPFHLLTSSLAHLLDTDPDTLHGHREPWARIMTGLQL